MQHLHLRSKSDSSQKPDATVPSNVPCLLHFQTYGSVSQRAVTDNGMGATLSSVLEPGHGSDLPWNSHAQTHPHPSLSPDIFTSVNEPMNLQWNSSHEQAAENGSNGMCKHGNPAFAVENVTHIESTGGMCKRGSPTLLSKL